MSYPIPEGYHSVIPHIFVKGAPAAIAFYGKAFGAKEIRRHCIEGTEIVMHAEIQIGDSMVMVNDEFPEHGVLAPEPGKSGFRLHLLSEDVDALFAQACAAGATVVMPLENMSWGDRYAIVADPFGHQWSMASKVEEVTDEEVAERARKAFGKDA